MAANQIDAKNITAIIAAVVASKGNTKGQIKVRSIDSEGFALMDRAISKCLLVTADGQATDALRAAASCGGQAVTVIIK